MTTLDRGARQPVRLYIRHTWHDGARSEVYHDPAAPFFVAEELRATALLLAELPGAARVLPGLVVVVASSSPGAWRLELAADARRPPCCPPTLTIQTKRGSNAERVAVLLPWRLTLALLPPGLPPAARDLIPSLARLACIHQPPAGAAPKPYKLIDARSRARRAALTPSHNAPTPKGGGEVTAPRRRSAGVSQREDDPRVALAR